MSTEQNKAIVRRFFEEVFNTGNFDRLDELFAPDFTGHGLASQGAGTGPDKVRHTVLHFRHAFPDIQFRVEEMIAEGDKVVVRVSFRGTHQGEFMGIPATGKLVHVSGVELARLENGKIIEEGWHYMDEQALLHQLKGTH